MSIFCQFNVRSDDSCSADCDDNDEFYENYTTDIHLHK